MTNILQKIALNKRREIEATKTFFPADALREAALRSSREICSMRRSILDTPGGVIAEFKRRSPSKGEIAPMADVSDVIAAYDRGGAAACSVLTDTPFFGGALVDLTLARSVTSRPLLRKEFIIDEYQIYQARIAGADAVLLIAALLTPGEIRRFTSVAHQMKMEVLLEIHSENELPSVFSDIDMVGINNRDLTDFTTDLGASLSLVSELPAGVVKIAESGIRSSADMERLRSSGFNGFLVGEALMSTSAPGETLKSLIDGNL